MEISEPIIFKYILDGKDWEVTVVLKNKLGYTFKLDKNGKFVLYISKLWFNRILKNPNERNKLDKNIIKWLPRMIVHKDILEFNFEERYFYLWGVKTEFHILKSFVYFKEGDKLHYVKINRQNKEYIIKAINNKLEEIIYDVAKEYTDYYFKLLFNTTLADVKYKISSKEVTTYWGKHFYRKKEIIYNLSLVHYDKKYLRATALHEVNHFKFPKHGQKFWNNMAKFDYEYYKIDRDKKMS
ncbi:YgjP-like metallopeptidase domain-containing protein [Metamycoplasma neophronis]|uniref:M48 family metallopeptidase n=1 Tax=Metamycoplasma neophronis TaxID=872983 RepID=A0ABY2Z4W7_9BACT|nr:YgjP-like metallopeptidase domain-containing protein [Metamycoplasma neophronis]TPR53718.1 M48 family metallopeptidase [Metamycoplasma neophronis]